MIYLLIPVYNEEGNIGNLHRELKSILHGENISIIFSDDGSNDRSLELIKEYFADFNYMILGDGINRGPGNAFNLGFNWILENSKNSDDIVVTLECDCTSDLAILPHMIGINKMGYELVLASVYAQGGGFDNTSFMRRLVSSTANLLYRFLFKLNVQTLSSFYRVYSLSLLKRVKANYKELITEFGFICMLEILLKSIRCDAKLVEVPMMLHSDKRVGKSKMKVFKTSMQYFRFLITFKDKNSN
jgi:dolichol-phosphate mannosyltransferase